MDYDILDDQLGFYEKQSGQLEEWQLLSKEVDLCYQVEDAIRLGLSILDGIEERNRRWLDSVRADKNKFRWHVAGELAGRFKWWLAASDGLLYAIDFCESHRYEVQGAAEFRRRNENAASLSLDVSRIRKSALPGQTTLTHEEAMNVLRTRLQRPIA